MITLTLLFIAFICIGLIAIIGATALVLLPVLVLVVSDVLIIRYFVVRRRKKHEVEYSEYEP